MSIKIIAYYKKEEIDMTTDNLKSFFTEIIQAQHWLAGESAQAAIDSLAVLEKYFPKIADFLRSQNMYPDNSITALGLPKSKVREIEVGMLDDGTLAFSASRIAFRDAVDGGFDSDFKAAYAVVDPANPNKVLFQDTFSAETAARKPGVIIIGPNQYGLSF